MSALAGTWPSSSTVSPAKMQSVYTFGVPPDGLGDDVRNFRGMPVGKIVSQIEQYLPSSSFICKQREAECIALAPVTTYLYIRQNRGRPPRSNHDCWTCGSHICISKSYRAHAATHATWQDLDKTCSRPDDAASHPHIVLHLVSSK